MGRVVCMRAARVRGHLEHEGLFQGQQALPPGGSSLHHLDGAPHLLQLQPLCYQLLPHSAGFSLQPTKE